MKLCIVASGDFFSNYGGGQVYVHNIVDELARHSELSTTVISFNANLQPSIKDYNDIQVHVVNDETSFYNALKSTKPDIVHANGEKLITSRLCKQLNIPCIVTAHHGGIVCPAGTLLNTDDEICNIPADYNHCLKCYLRNTPTGLFWYPLLKKYSQKHYCRIGERLEKLPSVPFLTPIGRTGQIVTKKLKDWKELVATATHFIAPSNAIAEALKRNGCPSDKITVIPHGIPYVHSTSSSQFSVLSSQFINFYYVGRINYVKGIHILLKAFSSIDNSNIRLHLIGGAGNASESRYMRRLQRKYKRDYRIIWHGKVTSGTIPEITKDFHCLVHPTICLEIFGLDIAEALAQNKYVIATRCGGAEMQINDSSSGLLVAPNNVKEMQNAMQRYCSEMPKPYIGTSKPIEIKDHVESLMSLYIKCRQ